MTIGGAETSSVTELWQHFALEPVERVPALDRATFMERYQGRCPVVVGGGAADTPAVRRWDPAYLAEVSGDAQVSVAAYRRDHRDYSSVEPRRMTLREFLADLGNGHSDEVRYLFNNQSCVFARNEDVPGFHIGWAAEPNPGLAPLATDIRLPPFVDPEAFVLAVIIVGSDENATDLHYDRGGEAKVLVQVRGRKQILLIPPSAAPELRPNPVVPGPHGPRDRPDSRPRLDIHAPEDEGSDVARSIHGYTAELQPGDVAYWPPFWFHDIANLDPVTIATGLFVQEVRLDPLVLRFVAGGIARALTEAARSRVASPGSSEAPSPAWSAWDLDVSHDGEPVASLGDLFTDLEDRLLSPELRHLRWLWDWNHRFWGL